MKRDFNINIKGFDDKELTQQVQVPVLDAEGNATFTEDGKSIVEMKLVPVVCKDAVVMALCDPNVGGENEEADSKITRAAIAERIYKAEGETEISLEEAGIIKKCVGKRFGPILVLQIMRFIEG